MIISMVDLCDLNDPRQFVRDVSIVGRKSARFTVVCKNEQSDNRISEFLYSNFMITSRTSINHRSIISTCLNLRNLYKLPIMKMKRTR